MTTTAIPDEVVAAISAAYVSGTSIADICDQHGVAQSTVYRIVVRTQVRRRRAPAMFNTRRIKRNGRQLSQAHGVCTRCHEIIQRGESYGVNGDGPYHLRDCQKWTLETGKRYNFIDEFGLSGETVRMAK